MQLDVGRSTLARHALGGEALLVAVEENDARSRSISLQNSTRLWQSSALRSGTVLAVPLFQPARLM